MKALAHEEVRGTVCVTRTLDATKLVSGVHQLTSLALEGFEHDFCPSGCVCASTAKRWHPMSWTHASSQKQVRSLQMSQRSERF